MNYKESVSILKEVKKASNILVNCHRGPDSDSVGSALALSRVLKNLGKEVTIICPSDVPADLNFLSGADSIKRVNFTTFDFTAYDIFFVIDSSTYSMVTGLKDGTKPSIDTIVIDHHVSNEKFGKINLVDVRITSTGELLYKVFEDWGVVIDKEIAECLLTGIIGDTGSFQYQNVGEGTLRIAASLMALGADKDKIIYNIYRSIDFKEVKMWGKFIESMKIEDNFIWSAIPLPTYKDFGEYPYAKEDVANLFFPVVKGTDFGVVMVETSDKVLSVSLRSRSGFDVSKVAEEVGGGGHKLAAGARIEGLPFDDAVNKVLAAARKYAKKD
jgi:phosphoesterase RecJ-like protein